MSQWFDRLPAIHPQIALAAIALVSLLLRFIRLDAESLWLDEAFSLWAAQLTVKEMMDMASWDPHPPLHYLLLKAWIGVFGITETAVRSLSVVAGAAAVWAMGQLFFAARQTEAGLYAAALLTFSPLHIWYSQETRSYALFFLAAIFATVTLIRAMRDPSRLNLGLHVVASAIAFYTHVYAVFLFAAHIVLYAAARLYAPGEDKFALRPFLAVYGLIALACVPWILVMVNQVKTIAAGFWIPKPTWSSVSDAYELLAGSVLLLGAVIALATFGFLMVRKEGMSSQRLLLLAALALALAFPLGAAIASWMWKPIFLVRATLPALAGLIGLAAIGLSQVPQRFQTIGLAVLLVGAGGPIYTEMSSVEKEDWRAVVGRVNVGADVGDIVILDAGFTRPVYDYYANRSEVLVLEVPDLAADLQPWLKENQTALKEGQRVWHVQAHSRDAGKLIPKELAAHHKVAFTRHYWGITISVWDPIEEPLTRPGDPKKP